MFVTKPNRDADFRCLASACPDTCCAGWEIVVDDVSADRFRAMEDAMGKRLQQSLVTVDGEVQLRRRPNGRCVLLNEKNLCDLYALYGEGALCRTCRLHPRFVAEYGARREVMPGLSCPAWIGTYLLDEEYLPDEFAKRYAMYSVKGGSDWTLFKTSSEELGLPVEMSVKWEDALAALENGQVVITQANPDSIFTDVGHFIVLTGVNEEGRIWVNDPYGGNYGEWSHPKLQDGFANGFEQRQFYHFCNPYWIYAHKSEVWDPYGKSAEESE